jgi:hypothetical protein
MPEAPWNVKECIVLRAWVNGYIEEQGLISFASDLNWEDEVASFNIISREVGCKAPWRTEAGTLDRFREDVEILKAYQHAQAVERRANSGAEVSWDDDHPEQLISVRVGN